MLIDINNSFTLLHPEWPTSQSIIYAKLTYLYSDWSNVLVRIWLKEKKKTKKNITQQTHYCNYISNCTFHRVLETHSWLINFIRNWYSLSFRFFLKKALLAASIIVNVYFVFFVNSFIPGIVKFFLFFHCFGTFFYFKWISIFRFTECFGFVQDWLEE